MKKIIAIAAIAAALLTSCRNGVSSKALPNVSGKAGEVLIVLDKADWEGNLGTEIRSVLGTDTPFLPQEEPLFSMVNVIPSGFSNMFKIHRNIIMFNFNPDANKSSILYKENIWAYPQVVLQINAANADSASAVFKRNGDNIINGIEQAERNRIIANTLKYEEKPLAQTVNEMIGGMVHFPTGYKLKKKTDDFIWIADERQYTNQGILIYKYPALPSGNFTEKNIIDKRNEILKQDVPGMFDNTYMTTSTYATPAVKFIKYKGMQFAETRGFWEVYNDYMGGPFVSHSFYSKDGKDIIVLEAFVYAPKFDKRQYLRQVESLLYSFEWTDKNKK
ncbi:MAG: DUF4837 family protein [Bacteroidales bacterium]|jgi:hypothetical protein|nr:DUF4837 family protein [Bacteroidales bacterium]MCI1785392.1 DUF4837 family protein [Bacteroidales bacterium]